MSIPTKLKSTAIRPWIATALLLASMTMASFADPRVLPIDSQSYGKSYGQWAEAWWQWALAIPAATNPLLDTTGQNAGIGQNGPVWFLAGTLGNSAERTLSIPAGKAIFMPIHVWIFGSTVGDCDPTNPGVPCDVPTLRASAAAATTAVTVMEVTIDGRAVTGLRDYRALSPDGFSITLPADNVPELLGLPTPAGTYGPHVADGYWLMLAPLSAGRHTVRVHAVNPAATLDYVVLCHINVTAGKSSGAPAAN